MEYNVKKRMERNREMSDLKWMRPVVTHIPDEVTGVAAHDIDLGGRWKLTLSPEAGCEMPGKDRTAWNDIDVPGEMRVLGFYTKSFCPYAYFRVIDIPADFEGKRVFLRFEGANCLTKVYLDGRFVRKHYGGYNSWDADITSFCVPGGRHELVLIMEDRTGEMSSFASGGLIRTVRLCAVPVCFVERLHVRTELLPDTRDMKLTVMTKTSVPDDSQLILTLCAPDGNEFELETIDVSDASDCEITETIASPLRWDSEHPNLYTLKAELRTNGIVTEKLRRVFGFRDIRIDDTNMYVNGDRIKLRGSDRHDSHPLRGHALTHQDIDEDVARFKEANVNLIRTSHYNPCQYFLDKCDREGIYVELETSVCFTGQGQDMVQDDPAYLPMFLEQLSESMEENLSRPAVIIWSLSNECIWGSNFRAEQDYAHAEDPTRPTVFSYPITIKKEEDVPDIWSVHYALEGMDPSLATDCMYRCLSYVKRPILHDEFMHVPCYIFGMRECDISVRDEWAETVQRFWNEIYETDGALGGAIWCGIDDAIWTPDNSRGPEWGIMDGFRRNKPETWAVKKGYTPVYIENGKCEKTGDGCVCATVKNRYNHTNLSEIRIEWEACGVKGSFYGPDCAPGDTCTIRIPVGDVQNDERVHVEFYEANGLMADVYDLRLAPVKVVSPFFTEKAPLVADEGDSLAVSGDKFDIRFSKETGKITCGRYGGVPIILDGPHINLKGRGVGVYDWKLDTLDYTVTDRFTLRTKGYYGRIGVEFTVSIDSEGLMDTRYRVFDMPFNSPRSISMVNGEDIGGYLEVGLYYVLTSDIDRLTWEKDGLYQNYPAWHIGRLQGTARKLNEKALEWRFPQKPEWDWKEDMFDFLQFGKDDIGGRGTRDFISGKSRIFRACAGAGNLGLTAYSDGRHQVRMELERSASSLIDCDSEMIEYCGDWFERKDPHGLLNGHEFLSRTKGDSVTVRFCGTGIAWYGSKYITHGRARVELDGKVAAERIELFSGKPSNAAKGRERMYGCQLYTVKDLPYGMHELKITVTGDHYIQDPDHSFTGISADNTYVSVDYFLLADEIYDGNVRMYLNDEYNFSDLHWGCYMKPPVCVDTGYTGGITVKMGPAMKENEVIE